MTDTETRARKVLDRSLPFLRSQALAAGFDPARRPTGLRQLIRGVWVGNDVPVTERLLLQAALVLHPEDAFASHQSAARVRGLPVPHCDRPHVSVWKQEHRTRSLEVVPHVACAETKVEEVAGIRVSTPLDLFVELSGVLPLVDLVVVGDAMVKRELFTEAELRTFCRSTRRRHARKARRGAEYVRAGVDSAMESRLRMLLVLAGLPEPQVNVKIFHEDGTLRYRLDLSYPHHHVIIEYDGRQHAENSRRWKSDIERREELEALGWAFVIVISEGVYQRPEETILRVARMLRRCGVRVDRINPQWRAHFPGR